MMRVKGLTGPQADSVHRIRGLMAPQVAGRSSQAAVRRPLWSQMPLRGVKLKGTISPRPPRLVEKSWLVVRGS